MQYIDAKTRWIGLMSGALIFTGTTVLFSLLHFYRPWAWGMMIGSLVAMAICTAIGCIKRRAIRKFEAAKSRVNGLIDYFCYAVVREDNMIRRGYVFLTKDEIRIFLWEKRPYLETTITKEEICIQYISTDIRWLGLIFEEKEPIEIFTDEVQSLLSCMGSCGYRIEPLTQSDENNP